MKPWQTQPSPCATVSVTSWHRTRQPYVPRGVQRCWAQPGTAGYGHGAIAVAAVTWPAQWRELDAAFGPQGATESIQTYPNIQASLIKLDNCYGLY